MTSLSAVLEIINSDLDAERNESMRKFVRVTRSNSKVFPSKDDEVNVSEESADAIPDNLAPTNLNFGNTKPEDAEHVQIFEKIYSLFATYAQFIGIQVTYEWNPRKNILFCSLIFIMAFTWSCIFNTQRIHIKNGEILRVLECCAIYGISTSCTQKVWGYLQKRQIIISLFYCIRKTCRQTVRDRQADSLKSSLQKTLIFLKMFGMGVASSLGLFVVCPLYSYIARNDLVSLLPLEIIFIDQSTFFGFVIANAVMIVMGTFATLGTIFYGAIFIYAIRMYSLQVNLIGQDFKDLDDMWADGSTVPLRYKQSLLRNICHKQQDIKNYISTVRNIYERKLFFYFCFNYFSQIICLFELTKNQWLPGLGIALGLFIEMMFYCVMGSQITTTDKQLCASIYAADWHRYDLSSQKIILLLLHQSQQSNELTLGPMGPLTTLTGIEVIKSIYSYYTVLTELL